MKPILRIALISLIIISKSTGQHVGFLDSIKTHFETDSEIPDSLFNEILSEIQAKKDSILLNSALNFLQENHNQLSANSYLELTKALLVQASSTEKIEVWRKAINILSFRKPLDTVRLAFAHNSLGEFLVTLNKNDEAIKLFIQAISLFPKNSNELEIGYSYNNLGVLMGRKGDEGSALPYKKKALEIFLEHLGEDHPYIGTLYNNVGMSYQRIGQPNQESIYLQKAMTSFKKHYPPCSPQLYMINNNLALSYRNSKNFKKAEEHVQTALDCIGESNIKSDPRYVKLLVILSSIKSNNTKENSREEMEVYYREYIELAEKHLGKYHPSISGLYNNFGVYLYEVGKPRSSIEHFEAFLYTKFPGSIGKNYLEYLSIDSIAGQYEYMTVLSNLGSAKFKLYKQVGNAHLLEESSKIFDLFDQLASNLRPKIVNSSSRLGLKEDSKRGYVLHNRTLVERHLLNPNNKVIRSNLSKYRENQELGALGKLRFLCTFERNR